MEQKIVPTPTPLPSLLMLNEYCLLDIFKFLNIDDSINLAKTCTWLRFVAKLRLNCSYNNINHFLRELATKGIIEELHLDCVHADDDFFDTLVSFSKLQLLVINSFLCSTVLKSSMAWPTKLKKLKLCYLELTKNDLMEMIHQLEAIETIDLQLCDTTELENTNFNDVTKLTDDIRHIIERSNRKQRLDINLPFYTSKITELKYVVDSAQLRILHRSNSRISIGVKIQLPDCNNL